MKIEALGDAAFIVRELSHPPFQVAEALLDLRDGRILDANASYETLGIYSMPGSLTSLDLEGLVEDLRLAPDQTPKRHDIPILYEGEDLPGVAKHLGISEGEVMALHCGEEYTCFAVGFCPGYPYLGWLPEELQGVPRLATPRTRTEPGSIGITGKQTGIYPLARPGGWPIIGRTPLTLVDVDDNYFPIRAGDLISFDPLRSEEEFRKLKGERL